MGQDADNHTLSKFKKKWRVIRGKYTCIAPRGRLFDLDEVQMKACPFFGVILEVKEPIGV